MQKYNKNKKGERGVRPIGGGRETKQEGDRKSQMRSWNDVPHRPRSHIPKYLVLEM